MAKVIEPRTKRIVFFLGYESTNGQQKGHVISRFFLTQEQEDDPDAYDQIVNSISEQIKAQLGFDVLVNNFNRLN
jgi:hypothetical protein